MASDLGTDSDGHPDSPFLAHPSRVAHVEGLAAGLGGRIRAEFEDFLVEEIPLHRPTGHGPHTVALIEKRGTPTFDALLFLSKGIKISERRIGYAGLKDSRAVARQYVSFPGVPPERVLAFEHPRVRILAAARHSSALKIGHHLGNRFTIRIQDADTSKIEAARQVLERLVVRGVPNAYGNQRFGVRQEGQLLGRSIVREDWGGFLGWLLGRPMPSERNPRVVEGRRLYEAGDLAGAFKAFPLRHRAEKKALTILKKGGSPKEVFESQAKGTRKIWLSAWQSYLFNRVLDARVRADTFDRLLPGDVGILTDSGARFRADGRPLDDDLARRGLATPSGPLVGYDQQLADQEAGQVERRVLAEDDAEPESFRQPHCRSRGGRRPLVIPVREASLEVEGPETVVARFVLPPGAFATVVLAHLMETASPMSGPSKSPEQRWQPPTPA